MHSTALLSRWATSEDTEGYWWGCLDPFLSNEVNSFLQLNNCVYNYFCAFFKWTSLYNLILKIIDGYWQGTVFTSKLVCVQGGSPSWRDCFPFCEEECYQKSSHPPWCSQDTAQTCSWPVTSDLQMLLVLPLSVSMPPSLHVMSEPMCKPSRTVVCIAVVADKLWFHQGSWNGTAVNWVWPWELWREAWSISKEVFISQLLTF